MIEINKGNLLEKITNDMKSHLFQTSNLDPKRIAEEYLSEVRIKEQISILSRYVGSIEHKKVLEVGSGYGMLIVFLAKNYSCEVNGLEPSDDEYSTTIDISKELAVLNAMNSDLIVKGSGEKMPFPDSYFDVVYSSNVLEHTKDPSKVIVESIRVLKRGGYLQFVYPNYGSFWEGHYCVFWIPYLSHRIARLYLRMMGKNPQYADSLNFVNYFNIKKVLRPYIRSNEIEILTWGEEIFKERMINLKFSEWAGLSKIKKWLFFLEKIKFLKITSWFMIKTKSFSPIVLTIRKK